LEKKATPKPLIGRSALIAGAIGVAFRTLRAYLSSHSLLRAARLPICAKKFFSEVSRVREFLV
jgi:hypothetical protein